MTKKELLDWFDQIQAQVEQGANLYEWGTNARSAMGSAFPPGHPVLKQWDQLMKQMADKSAFLVKGVHAHSFKGIFSSAHSQLKSGYLDTLVGGVQAETVSEILDQAEHLANAGYVVAAAVLAGGALETHLLHLCNRAGLAWSGDGSITKYDTTMAQARNKGTTIYSATDTKSVTSWGGTRNDAAHDPGGFDKTAAEVRLMIEGIRQFVARVP